MKFFKILISFLFAGLLAACGGGVAADTNGNLTFYWTYDTGVGSYYQTNTIVGDTILGPIVTDSSLMTPPIATGVSGTLGTFAVYCPTTRPAGCVLEGVTVNTVGASIASVYDGSVPYVPASTASVSGRVYLYTIYTIPMNTFVPAGAYRTISVQGVVVASRPIVQADNLSFFLRDSGQHVAPFMVGKLASCTFVVHAVDCPL